MNANIKSKSIVLNVTEDGLSATISAGEHFKADGITEEDLLQSLNEAHIILNDDVNGRLRQYLEVLGGEQQLPEEFEIASGRPLVECKDGVFNWDENYVKLLNEWCSGESADFYNMSSIVTVETDQLMGTISPPEPAIDGVDVFGRPLSSSREPRAVVLGDTVKLGDDGFSVFAATAGKVIYDDNKLTIREVVEIRSDVNFKTGNLDVNTDLIIRGNISDMFAVKTIKDLTVDGSIEAAEVDVAGSITVRGGILNRAKGHVIAGGDVVAKYCVESDIKAAGSIRFNREILNSQIAAEGKVIIPRGRIIGGRVTSKAGLEVDTIGSDAVVPTQILVGLPLDELKQERALRATRRSVAATRERKPYVLVNTTVHAGVTITIDDRVVTVSRELKGPISIEFRKINNYTAVAAVNQLTGSITELQSSKLD